ncbi:aldolase/citrate lyase family protein [Campylobacter lari]|uniref:HpcH/HpaI aldolase family protein n=1 Tax=Campylobacter lari TaxID=201 RepID=UPI00127D9C71|nr:aldolase/citrate lyase family protein [Campylobacter lari]EAJ8706384.1 2,4-dihydroxyhept-2-ene-1,7-dioic acid aldolase [Campylobacter jejuni]EAI7253436.1 2,4-dihydroxyhept-2-ene-1,7-dioic acid aldolase [Campylobacter lari]EAK0442348.1 2,4-dihydroxyhept-2-ene-1,7-dioic acid aldolase [Campylobacter lari]EAL0060406.1 2,4-dihydroxyhept-2-ene-1,7-dioic acid aldolase [Campylobacter lari]ECL4969360.1 2,4-dihydroxyhept-2-ene-1,7-dioic acid aldolase [Campylobacter lari]
MNVKEKLQNNKLTIGSWISIGHPCVVEIMSNAGFEWLVIDFEHTSMNYETVQNLIITIQSKKIKALVRVCKNEEVIIKKVLDMGADGIIVPMIKNKIDAIKAVEFAKYPPAGGRGVGLFRAQNYGLKFEEYKQWVDENLIIIAQVEHYEAVENIEEIIKTDGIDGVIIGPYDLSGSLGFPGEYHRAEVKEAIAKVLKCCKRYNIPSGFHVIETDPKKLQEKIHEGCTFLAYSIDFLFLSDNAIKGMEIIKKDIR